MVLVLGGIFTGSMLASVGLDIDMRVWLVRVEGVHE